jgi:hypothetical protein
MTLSASSLLALAMLQQPGLQPRSSNSPDDHPVVVVRNQAKSVMPEDASGLYRFDNSDTRKGSNFGEGIEIDEQFDEVTGYLTIKASPDGGKPSMQSYFLARVEGGGGELKFTTKPVHGIWYSFAGTLVRGPGATRANDGYYLLSGTLTMHDDTRQTTQQRTISLKQTALH